MLMMKNVFRVGINFDVIEFLVGGDRIFRLYLCYYYV